MSLTEAAELRRKWEERQSHSTCQHHNLEMVVTPTGRPSSFYACMICGETIRVPGPTSTSSPL